MLNDFFSNMVQRAQLRESLPGEIQPRLAARFEAPLAPPILAMERQPAVYDLVDAAAANQVFHMHERQSAATPATPPAVQPPTMVLPASHVTMSLQPSEAQPTPVGSQATFATPLVPPIQAQAPAYEKQEQADPITFSVPPERIEHEPLLRKTVAERIVQPERLISTPRIVEPWGEQAQVQSPVAMVPERPAAGIPDQALSSHAATLSPSTALPPRSDRPLGAQPATTGRPAADAKLLVPRIPTAEPPHAKQKEEQHLAPISAQPGRSAPERLLRESIIQHIVEHAQLPSGPKIVEARAKEHPTPALNPRSSAVPPHEKALEPTAAVALPMIQVAQAEPTSEPLSRPQSIQQAEAVRSLISPITRKPEAGRPIRGSADRRTNEYGALDRAVAAPAPTIYVSIGRIEVRATPAPPAAAPKRQSAPVMTLEEYLQRRTAGGK